MLTKSQTNLTAGSPVQITGTLTGAYSNQAAQSIIGSSPSQTLSAYNGQPFINGSFVSPTISANLTSGNNGGFFGNGVFGGNTDYNSGFWNWGGGNTGGGNNGGTGG